MLDLVENMYVQAAILSFFAVCVIKWMIIPGIEGIINGINITKSKKRIKFFKNYIYFIIPGIFSVIFTIIRPVDECFPLSLFIYFGIQTFIFKSAFKPIVARIENMIRRN